MDGNQALAYGLIAAGVRYGAGYPITPWSSVMEMLRRELPKYGGIFVQAEDELGAVSIALGFSYSGYLAVTGSAGPGHFAQDRSDRLGVDGRRCRSSLSTCSAADRAPACRPMSSRAICIRRFSAVTATVRASCSRPATVEDCFYIAIEAARIARKYSTPVFILSDTSLATRIEAFDEPELPRIDGRSETGSLAARRRLQALCARSDHATRPARHADARREISARRPDSNTTRWAIPPAARSCTWP